MTRPPSHRPRAVPHPRGTLIAFGVVVVVCIVAAGLIPPPSAWGQSAAFSSAEPDLRDAVPIESDDVSSALAIPVTPEFVFERSPRLPLPTLAEFLASLECRFSASLLWQAKLRRDRVSSDIIDQIDANMAQMLVDKGFLAALSQCPDCATFSYSGLALHGPVRTLSCSRHGVVLHDQISVVEEWRARFVRCQSARIRLTAAIREFNATHSDKIDTYSGGEWLVLRMQKIIDARLADDLSRLPCALSGTNLTKGQRIVCPHHR